MTTPHRRILDLFEGQREQPEVFHDRLDVEGFDAYVREYVEKVGIKVHLMPLSSGKRSDQGKSPIDWLDGDILEPEWREEKQKLNLTALVEHEKSRQDKTKKGVNETRTPIFYFSRSQVKELGLVSDLRFRGVEIGDIVIWDGTWYQVTNSHRDGYHGQADAFFLIKVNTRRYEQPTVGPNQRIDP